MSDSDPTDPQIPVPPALQSMWRLLKLGYSHEPGLVVFAVIATVASAIPDALLALWLKLLADGTISHHRGTVLVAVLGMAGSITLTWLLNTVTSRITRRFRDRVTIALETHVARLQASIGTVAHQERPEYLDRLSVLRQQIFVLDHMYLSVLTTLSWLIRLGVTLVLLATVHPLLILLAIFAVPTVVSASVRPTAERAVEESSAVHQRLAEHLFTTATTASAGKEVRITGIGDTLVADRRAEWERWYTKVSGARWITAGWNAVAWAVFGLGFAGAVIFVAAGLHGTPGQVLLLLTAGARLSDYVSATVSEIGFLRGIWLDGARRLAWLEDYAAAVALPGDQPAPDTITDGIVLDNVTFRYPGSDRAALENASVTLPAGTVIALVGENGAGKSTLVKLLTKMYQPQSGRITVDGRPLESIDTSAWRDRLAGAFQDFHRFEFNARTSIGLGELSKMDDDAAVRSAVHRAGADDVIDKLTDQSSSGSSNGSNNESSTGLDAQLGATWPGGIEVSFGQWQKLALARGFMRDEPLLLVLDEPTAALDAETEHALFERYAGAVRRAGNGGITVLVSHRFSTVRMADLIVVMDGAHIAQVGSHDELMRQGGSYSELYRIQQQAYR